MRDAFAYGVLTAAFAGVLTGAAMKPASGAFDPEVLGPAMQLSNGSRETVSNAYDGQPGLAAYKGEIPDYVLGTDSARPLVYELAYYDSGPHADAAPGPEPAAGDAGFAAPVKVSYPPPVPRPASPEVSAPAEDDIERVTPTLLVEAAAAKPDASGAG